MTLRKIHEEEEVNWTKFKRKIKDFDEEPKMYQLLFERLGDGRHYHAKIPELFPEVIGEGDSPEEARVNLLEKLKTGRQSNN